jgi:hypothetical protein
MTDKRTLRAIFLIVIALTIGRKCAHAQNSSPSLVGDTVSVGVYEPTANDLVSNTATAIVGNSTPTFPVGALSTTSGESPVIPVSINVTASAIELDYSANDTAVSAQFNGYEFFFNNASGANITGVFVDPASTVQPVGLVYTDSTVSVNVEGLTFTSSDKLIIDVVTGLSANVPLQFIPVKPCRVADTRNATGPFGGPELSAGTTREFVLPQSACSIPSSAAAYSLNVTVVPNGPLGYLTLYPSDEVRPTVSTLNSDGRVKANAAIVPAGLNGGVSVYVTDPSHVILDIDGYFVPAGTQSALAFYPVPPCRLVDTRYAAAPLGGPALPAGSTREFPLLSGSCALPPDAEAYSLNVTAIPSGQLNYLTMWPSGQTQPLVSTLNAPTGEVTANAAIVPAGTNGNVSVFVYDTSDLAIDVNGYFAAPGTPSVTSSLSYYTMVPCRALDTRLGNGAFSGTQQIAVIDSGCPLSITAQSYVLNATVVPTGSLNFLTLWAAGETQPLVSTLNASDGVITSNMAIVPTRGGLIDAFAYDPTQLILDVSGYFGP